MTMTTQAALEGAKQKLKIRVVHPRQMLADLRDDIDIERINKSDAEITQQSLRRFNQVVEAELVRPDTEKSLWQYVYRYSLGVRLMEPDDDKNEDDNEPPLLVISAEFCAYYLSTEKLSEEEAGAFAQDNALYHIWPYWREFVQSTCCRLGLHRPVNVPTYTITQPVQV